MIDSNKEAKKYRVGRKKGLAILDEKGLEVALCRKGYEDVAIQICEVLNNSKYVKSKIIQVQIDVLKRHIEHPNKPGYKRHDVLDSIKSLEQELKQLQNETNSKQNNP